MERVLPGVLALIVGAAVIVLAIVPIVAASYRRREGFSAARLVAWLALIVYLVGLWAYTLTPIPATTAYACVGAELNPFADVAEIFRLADGGNPLRNPAVQQIAFNVLLFMPLGAFVVLLSRRGVVTATVVGLGGSLLIELTQLTGVWGLFPCAYRLFDTGDLVTNTLGATLGALAALPLRARRRGREGTGAAPARVTAGRRLMGMLIDVIVVATTQAVVELVILVASERLGDGLPEWTTPVGVLASLLPQAVSVGATASTLGEHVVLVRGRERRMPAWLARPIRFAAGIGGFVALSTLGGPWADLFAVVSIIAVFASRGRRGLASTLSGMDADVVAARAPGREPARG
ncbi:VanZ family protein [Agromyces arachidis]|uniref:VanZ family protein n=1 Tax=Agromyces arachidis TaxID=766966 RepID=UPI004056E87E